MLLRPQLRNKGIIVQNRELCIAGKADFNVIKKTAKDTEVVHCHNCNGSYSKKYFYRHPSEAAQQKAVHASLLNVKNRYQQPTSTAVSNWPKEAE